MTRLSRAALAALRTRSPVSIAPVSMLSTRKNTTAATLSAAAEAAITQTLGQAPEVAPRPSSLCSKRAAAGSLENQRSDGGGGGEDASSPVSFYRKRLPEDLICFTSELGRELFKESLDAGMVENYFSLVGNFTTQTETAYCGLGSMAMVLNALEVDPGRMWKGSWRWYSDEMLDCCEPLEVVRQRGIAFDQFVCLAECHGLMATARRFDQTTLAQFEGDLMQTATETGCHMVVSFSRKALGQTGVGHYSPIGAYNSSRRAALVLDVARFKYPSYWAPIDKLWRAMETVDTDTGLPRGYVMLQRSGERTRITGCP